MVVHSILKPLPVFASVSQALPPWRIIWTALSSIFSPQSGHPTASSSLRGIEISSLSFIAIVHLSIKYFKWDAFCFYIWVCFHQLKHAVKVIKVRWLHKNVCAQITMAGVEFSYFRLHFCFQFSLLSVFAPWSSCSLFIEVDSEVLGVKIPFIFSTGILIMSHNVETIQNRLTASYNIKERWCSSRNHKSVYLPH